MQELVYWRIHNEEYFRIVQEANNALFLSIFSDSCCCCWSLVCIDDGLAAREAGNP